jgi:hypothetical protein
MRTAGHHPRHIVIPGTRTIHGVLYGGATVTSRARFTVGGRFLGPALIAEGAVLVVCGDYSGIIAKNEGTIFLCGRINFEQRCDVGRVLICAGSLVAMRGELFRLCSTGALHPVRWDRGEPHELSAGTCAYVEDEDRFEPLNPEDSISDYHDCTLLFSQKCAALVPPSAGGFGSLEDRDHFGRKIRS